ncbi:MAG TPA: hypothetical protein VK808_12585 [Bacteroidia bacterium]|jgi:hypothetical protein|nr:hypothetical protein [Bacteroidia bacterium]
MLFLLAADNYNCCVTTPQRTVELFFVSQIASSALFVSTLPFGNASLSGNANFIAFLAKYILYQIHSSLCPTLPSGITIKNRFVNETHYQIRYILKGWESSYNCTFATLGTLFNPHGNHVADNEINKNKGIFKY